MLNKSGNQTIIASQGQSITDQLPDRIPDGGGGGSGQTIVYLEQIRLDVGVRSVEYEIGVRAARHLWHVLVSVYYLRNEHNLVLQHFDNALVFAVHIVVVPGLRELTVHGPHFPRDALGLEGPAGAALLEELEADGAAGGRRRAVHTSQQSWELRYLALHIPPEELRLAADVCEVYEVAVDVHVADGADGVALLVVVSEFPAGAVEEDGVEDAGDDLVHLAALHRQLEGDAARVHGGSVAGAGARYWHNHSQSPRYERPYELTRALFRPAPDRPISI